MEEEPKKSKKRGKYSQPTTATPANDEVEAMLKAYPSQMENIHTQLQELLCSCGDTNTRVEKLVRVTRNLRYQCRNVNSRSCILSSEAHQSNNPILWLDAPKETNEGELSCHYYVIYNCKSSECQGQGIIGEIELDENDGLYKHKVKDPPIINQNPKGLALMAKTTTTTTTTAMQNFMDILQNSQESEIDFEEQERHTRDLVQERIKGYGWSKYDFQIFGTEKTYQKVLKFAL